MKENLLCTALLSKIVRTFPRNYKFKRANISQLFEGLQTFRFNSECLICGENVDILGES